MKKKYEIMYILDRDTGNFDEQKQKIKQILTANGGSIIEENDWGLMDFAYPINKKTSGRYVVMIVETKSENILEFQRISKIDKNIVRTLVINTENEINYIQNTKLSKTDMNKLLEEQKKYYENKNNKYDREKNFQAKAANNESNQEVEKDAEKAVKEENK